MTREEVLQRLDGLMIIMHDVNDTKGFIAYIQNLCIKLTPAKKMWAGKLGFGIKNVIITLISLFVLFGSPILYVPIRLATIFLDYSMSLLLMRAAAVIISIFMPKLVAKIHNIWARKKNVRIEEQNDRIRQKNMPLTEISNQETGRLNELTARLRQSMSGWYPEAYATMHHAESFFQYIQDYEADSIKEAIDRYKTDKHRQTMEQTQRAILSKQDEMIHQQKINNELQRYGLVLQAGTLHAINRGNQKLDEIRDATIAGHSGTRMAIDKNTDAVNKANRTLKEMQ